MWLFCLKINVVSRNLDSEAERKHKYYLQQSWDLFSWIRYITHVPREKKTPTFIFKGRQSQRTSRALLEIPSNLNKNIKQCSVHTQSKYWKAKMWGQKAEAALDTWDEQQPLTLLAALTPLQQQVKHNSHFSAMRVKENAKVPWWLVLLKAPAVSV